MLKSLCLPKMPKDRTYALLTETLKKYYEPKPLVIAERHRFYRRVQRADESVAEYLAELRQLATYCEFARLEEALWDWLVCGLRNETVQKKLLS